MSLEHPRVLGVHGGARRGESDEDQLIGFLHVFRFSESPSVEAQRTLKILDEGQNS